MERAPEEANSQDPPAPGHPSGEDSCGKLGNEPC